MKIPLISAGFLLLAGLILRKEALAFQLQDTYYVISYFSIAFFISAVVIGLGLIKMRKRPARTKS